MLYGKSPSDGDLMGKSTKTPFDGEGSTTHVAKSQEKTITNPTGSPTVISIPMVPSGLQNTFEALPNKLYIILMILLKLFGLDYDICAHV